MAAIVPASVWHPLAHTATFEDESAERAMKKVSFFCSPDVSVLSSFSLIISPPHPSHLFLLLCSLPRFLPSLTFSFSSPGQLNVLPGTLLSAASCNFHHLNPPS